MTTEADDLARLQRALAGQYSIEREIGRGGMGVVYLAREVVLDRNVAIKVLPPALAENADSRERFLREARIAAKLFHPNIVPIHRVDTVGDVVFIAMAFVDGESAVQRVASRGPLPISEALRILRETAWALSYAHARGVIHRDVKPDNLLIERGTGRVFVTDFGIAQVEGASSLTRDGQLFGSVLYMSPEQITSAPIDGRSDLYSLGIVAHVLLTSRAPFSHASATAILAMHLNTPAPSIAASVPGLSPRIAEAIDRCLAKNPADRHATLEVFTEAISETERRREIPPVLRAWLDGAGLIDTGVFAIGIIAFTAVVVTEGRWWAALALPVIYATAQRARQTRRVMGMGFDVDDFRAGLADELRRRSEETASRTPVKVSRVAKVLRLIAKVALGFFVAGFAGVNASLLIVARDVHWMPPSILDHFISGSERAFVYGAITSVVALLLAELVSPSVSRMGPKERELNWRLRFWSSGIGRGFARLLKLGLKRAAAPARADRPTESVVGAAAVALFDTLPAPARKQLPEVAQVIRGLEAQANRLRARLDALDHDPNRAAAADMRVEVEARLRVAVASLETIRLDLLRLHAGERSTGDLTANVEAAAAIAAEIDRLLAGRQAVAQLLSPRGNPTPR